MDFAFYFDCFQELSIDVYLDCGAHDESLINDRNLPSSPIVVSVAHMYEKSTQLKAFSKSS